MELSEALCLKPKPLQNVTPKRIARLERQNHFLTLLFKGHITFSEAAREVGISRQQAYRWFKQWKLNEGDEIDREWWQLYNRLLDEDPTKAFEGLTRLKYRMTPQETTLKQEVKIEKKIDVDVTNYNLAVEASINYIHAKKNPTEPLDTPQTTPETNGIPPTAT